MVKTLGPLRVFLCSMAFAVIALSPFAMAETTYLDWNMVPTVIAPIAMVMLAFVLPLDLMMTRVFLAGAESDDERLRLKRIMWTEGGVLVLMLAAWVPFLNSLFPE